MHISLCTHFKHKLLHFISWKKTYKKLYFKVELLMEGFTFHCSKALEIFVVNLKFSLWFVSESWEKASQSGQFFVCKKGDQEPRMVVLGLSCTGQRDQCVPLVWRPKSRIQHYTGLSICDTLHLCQHTICHHHRYNSSKVNLFP